MSTYKLLEIAAQTWPKRIAIVETNSTISYQELFDQTEIIRTALIELGITPGMGLGIMGRNGIAFVAAMFAGMGCGAVVLPLSHQLKQAEIEHILTDTQIHAVLDDQSNVLPISGETNLISFLQQTLRFTWTNMSGDKPMTVLKDAAFIRYTSGTTGKSKGVVLSHHSINERVICAQNALKLSQEDAVVWVLPMPFHFLVSILVYIRSGAKIIICKDILAQSIINAVNQHKATMLYASPLHMRLLAADLSDKTMSSVKTVISTSAGLPAHIADAFEQRFNISVTQAYGIIEVGLPLIDHLTGKTNPETVGYPVTGFSVAILGQQNQLVADGEIGRLAIKGKGMFDAYLKPWQLAKQVMNDGWFMTGDLAQRNKEGGITICGREKTMINVSGNKAFPEEIEVVLNSHPDIIASHVFSQSHPLMGEIISADVMVGDDVILDVEAVLQFCRSQLSTYKIPQRLKQVAYIAQTQSGKIKRIKY